MRGTTDRQGRVHVVWGEFSKRYARILHSVFEENAWSHPEVVHEERNPSGTPATIVEILANGRCADGIRVGWIVALYPTPSSKERRLEICLFRDGECRDRVVISRGASSGTIVDSTDSAVYVAYQEFLPADGRYLDHADQPLRLARIVNGELRSVDLLMEHTVEGAFDGAADSRGRLHFAVAKSAEAEKLELDYFAVSPPVDESCCPGSGGNVVQGTALARCFIGRRVATHATP